MYQFDTNSREVSDDALAI